MKVVPGPNLGSPMRDPFALAESKKTPREPGLVGGEPYSNKLQNTMEKLSKATDVSQSMDFYKVRGAFVDKIA